MPADPDPGVAAALAAIRPTAPDHIYFVACGGSLSIMHPAKFLLDQHGRLPGDVMNAAEFVHRAPARLGPGSLVILCSMTGTTAETVAAAGFARARGARTVCLTMEPGSPLGRAGDHVVTFEAPYTTGVPIDARDSNYARIYELVLGLVRDAGGPDLMATLLDSLGHLQGAIDRADRTFAPIFDDYAPRLARQGCIYTLASGAGYGAAYSFAICVLMEMQWIDSQAIHANEFFHGPFEVVDADRAFILLKGLDSTRPLEERAEAFLHRFADPGKVMVLDAATLELDGIAPELRGNLVPLVFFDTLWRFAYRIAALRGHEMLTARRYMKTLDDY